LPFVLQLDFFCVCCVDTNLAF